MNLRIVLLLAVFLTACGGGPPKRIFAPDVRIQQLHFVSPDRVELSVRIQNYSTVPMHFTRIDGELILGDGRNIKLDIAPNLQTLPGSAEVFKHQVNVINVNPAATAIRYKVSGIIYVSEPKGQHDFVYESVLTPTPGLAGTYR